MYILERIIDAVLKLSCFGRIQIVDYHNKYIGLP